MTSLVLLWVIRGLFEPRWTLVSKVWAECSAFSITLLMTHSEIKILLFKVLRMKNAHWLKPINLIIKFKHTQGIF